ncbi:acyl carrier protein [Streptomyces pini]|uniref:Acyl carrier protein n=1 Tax=Streptomyces pini TaxID=1520580 RepID=A0A1I4L0K4_9ACTN|nr:acyl carrier protein [Streptomyces pini]SFL84550.1 Acyl carrier protein [Streptomyces pini]
MITNEREMCELFAEVLGIPEVEAQDDFFDLGGHSLLAAQLVRRIHGRFGVMLPSRRVYRAPTAEALVRELNAAAPAAMVTATNTAAAATATATATKEN